MTLKKTLCLVFTLLLAIALVVSCGGGNDGGDNNTPTTPQEPTVTLTNIQVVEGSYSPEYYIGMEFDASTLEILATYSDGSTKTVTGSEISVLVPPDLTKDGDTVIILGYGGLSTSVDITVGEDYVTGISVRGLEEQYVWGTKINTDNVVVTVSYASGALIDVPYAPGSGVALTLPETNVAGLANIRVAYQETSSITLEVEIIDPIVSVEIDTPHRKFEFRQDTDLATIKSILSNLKLNVLYTSGLKEVKGINDISVNYSEIDVSAPTTEDKKFTASFGGFSIEAPYSVKSILKFSAITLDVTNEFKTSYIPGESLDDPNKLKVRVIYSDGTFKTLTATDVVILDFSEISTKLNTPGEYFLNITYTDNNGTVDVVDDDESITLSLPIIVYGVRSVTASGLKTEYALGDRFDENFPGAKITIVYESGEEVVIDYANRASNNKIISSKLTVLGIDDVRMDAVGEYRISFSYMGTEGNMITLTVLADKIPDTDGSDNNTDKVPLN